MIIYALLSIVGFFYINFSFIWKFERTFKWAIHLILWTMSSFSVYLSFQTSSFWWKKNLFLFLFFLMLMSFAVIYSGFISKFQTNMLNTPWVEIIKLNDGIDWCDSESVWMSCHPFLLTWIIRLKYPNHYY